MESVAEIGVFGGSGFYSLLEHPHEQWIETPYGLPSDSVHLGDIAGRRVAFLPRHGRDHRFPPHTINYRANIYAMKSLGVKWILGPTASGSLAKAYKPGSMVVCDQVVDRTWGRKDTFYDGPRTTHVSFADPYCPTLRPIAVAALRSLDIETHERGTVVVVQGPRFSTRAESKWFQAQGWEVINMTQYPECYLARELEMCYVNVSLVTDYDVGLEGVPPVSHVEVIEVFKRNNERIRKAIGRIVDAIPVDADCSCRHALETARL
ncbi:MAG: S-methyl-5'-thioadenosine phosphorylase [Candidatus Eremiobacteraeota bacterium]|nr:S-methyl-5'-thioadenosine phosphorylase [Candidatus Eremiobacteraeota bacterium]MBV8435132.1 S-methyl-5'-thioadenosine phosphorylase [Candidatus Eremiobacteraeota bacterium]MBV8722570.1 S-methyl-5'-thioadenosine phosphorylase [Candidatus Eremiobacteraeota bacterium]